MKFNQQKKNIINNTLKFTGVVTIIKTQKAKISYCRIDGVYEAAFFFIVVLKHALTIQQSPPYLSSTRISEQKNLTTKHFFLLLFIFSSYFTVTDILSVLNNFFLSQDDNDTQCSNKRTKFQF